LSLVTIDEVIAEVDSELIQPFGVGTPPPAAPTSNADYMGASPYYWGNQIDVLQRGMGWPSAPQPAQGGFWGWQTTITNVVPAITYQSRLALSQLAQGLAGAKVYATQVAQFFATLAANQAASGASGANAYAQALFNNAEADIHTVAAQALRWAVDAQNNAVGVAQGLHSTAEADIATVAAQALRWSVDAQNNAVGVAQGLHSTAEADIATTQANALRQAIDAQNNAVGVAQGLFNKVEQDLGTVANNAQVFATTAAAAAAAAAAAQLQTQLQPQIDQLKTETDQCLAPLCDEVSPNAGTLGKLGKTLTLFKDLGLAGLLVTLAAEAVHDPAGSAHALEDALGWTSGIGMDIENAVMG
jgi:hypothetical protein